MKKLALLFSLCFVVLTTTLAQKFGLNAQTGIKSKYIGPDGLLFYKNPVMQGSFTLDHKKTGLYFDLWYSLGSDFAWSKDWDEEIDYSIGWSGKISPLKIDASLSYFDNFQVWHGPYRDVIKGNVHIESPAQMTKWYVLIPFVNYTRFWIPSDKTEFRGGNLYSIGLNNEIQFSSLMNASLLCQLTRDDGAFGAENGYLFKFSSAFGLRLSNHLGWNVAEITVYSPLGRRQLPNEENKFMPCELVFSTGLSWSL